MYTEYNDYDDYRSSQNENMMEEMYGVYEYDTPSQAMRGGKKAGKGGRRWMAALMAFMIGAGAAVGGAAALHTGSIMEARAAETDDSGRMTLRRTAENEEMPVLMSAKSGSTIVTDVTEVVDDVMPSIVSVYNNYTMTGQSFFGQSFSQEAQSAGTGIIIGMTDDEVVIVTNNHVIDGEESMEVEFYDGKKAPAQMKGSDSENDIAVIAVSMDDLEADTRETIKIAKIGDSDALKVGEPAIAFGNALGYGQSVTVGVVSAVNRTIQTEDQGYGYSYDYEQPEEDEEDALTYIQTDAAINPGNSGGALCNINGEVIGINEWKIGSMQVEGMCYAIPVSRVIDVIEDLMNEKTKVKVDEEDQGYIGISGVTVDAGVAGIYNIPKGAYVAEIVEDSAAADSDLKKGDVIVAVNGSKVSGMEELKEQLTYYKAGEEITLTVKRTGENGEYKEKEITLTLGTKETLEKAASDREDDDEKDDKDEEKDKDDSND